MLWSSSRQREISRLKGLSRLCRRWFNRGNLNVLVIGVPRFARFLLAYSSNILYGAANTSPMKGEMDWAVPQTGAGHTAKVSHNLPETTKSVRLSIRPG